MGFSLPLDKRCHRGYRQVVQHLFKGKKKRKAPATLRELTELVVIRNNDTSWLSSYNMIYSFFEIENQLRQVRQIELPRDSDLQVL